MENLSLYLQDYKEIIGSIASVVTIGQFFSGTFICKDIYKKGSTEGISSNPFVGGLVIGILMSQYSIMLNDSPMFTVNIAVIILNVLYLIFYLWFTKTKESVLKSLKIGALVVAVLFGYIKIENQNLVEYRYGLIVTVLCLSLIGSGLLEIGDIIKKKDASVIPFPLVLSGSVVSLLWFLYGVILLNDFMIVQNTIGFILCVIQLVLCFMYPGDRDQRKKKE